MNTHRRYARALATGAFCLASTQARSANTNGDS